MIIFLKRRSISTILFKNILHFSYILSFMKYSHCLYLSFIFSKSINGFNKQSLKYLLPIGVSQLFNKFNIDDIFVLPPFVLIIFKLFTTLLISDNLLLFSKNTGLFKPFNIFSLCSYMNCNK